MPPKLCHVFTQLRSKKLTAFLIGILELLKVNTAPVFLLPESTFLRNPQPSVSII